MSNNDTQNYIPEMMLSSVGSGRNHVGHAFGRFELVPGEEREGSPVYRQAHSKEIKTEKKSYQEIPTKIDLLMYR